MRLRPKHQGDFRDHAKGLKMGNTDVLNERYPFIYSFYSVLKILSEVNDSCIQDYLFIGHGEIRGIYSDEVICIWTKHSQCESDGY